jgi:hypothetical protein
VDLLGNRTLRGKSLILAFRYSEGEQREPPIPAGFALTHAYADEKSFAEVVADGTYAVYTATKSTVDDGPKVDPDHRLPKSFSFDRFVEVKTPDAPASKLRAL